MDGALVIDKPPGLTSHDVVVRARRILRERRVGHTGTLDPFATGVLVVLLGRATRLAQFLSGVDKEYEAIIRLGYSTDTGDRTGTPIPGPAGKREAWTEEEIEAALQSLRGEIDQVPPMYSAKKVEGRKLYELARRGETVERQPIHVHIYEFAAMRPAGQLIKDNLDGTFDFHTRVSCSSGTYVRTLAEDFGKRLYVGAHLAELRRTRVGDFSIDQANTLDDLKIHFGEESIGAVLVPPGAALSQLPFVHLTPDDVSRANHGREVRVAESNWSDGENVRMCDGENELVAVGRYDANTHSLHPRVVLAQ
ncbi:MAG TPA: tRNA pseudouridine(55) synthase TruB [Pyrinomonadaceae bacterium]|jgi:tRNA pseudouridine55 synthase|nr:tRNA pseudouridine(55) synthase TruB [Pyrinomonadaceae bacterium]